MKEGKCGFPNLLSAWRGRFGGLALRSDDSGCFLIVVVPELGEASVLVAQASDSSIRFDSHAGGVRLILGETRLQRGWAPGFQEDDGKRRRNAELAPVNMTAATARQ